VTPAGDRVSPLRTVIDRLRGWAVRAGDEGIVRRRPGDAVRVVVAAAVVALLALHAGNPTEPEQAIVDFFTSLPDFAEPLFVALYNLAALWALVLLAAAGLLLRRWRLARDLLLAGAGAWLVGRLLAFVVLETGLREAFEVVLDPTDAPRFPAVRVAVAVAMVTVASPHLRRPTRRIGQLLVLLVAVAAIYLARAGATDLAGAVVLGWGIAAAVHLALGTPDRRPTTSQVEQTLAALGVAATGVHPAPDQPVSRAVFDATDDDGRLRIDALGRDEAEAQLLARLWRFVAYRDDEPAFFLTRSQQVEHEAYVVLLARAAGVRAPEVVIAGRSGALALLVQRVPTGTALADLDPATVDDALLELLWQQVLALQQSRIAHGALDAQHVLVTEGQPAILGFEAASTSVGFGQLDADVAQMLAATAGVVGVERAVSVARRAIGRDRLASALPGLQAPALTDATRSALGDDVEATLAALRTRGADELGIEEPALRPLYRVQPKSLLMAVGALFAVGFLLAQVGDPVEFWESVKDAEWGYVALAFVIGVASDVSYAVAFLGTVPVHLRLWPAIELQSALSFSNLAVPVAADTAMQVRFLQKQGLDLSSAVATGGLLSTLSEIVVQVALFFGALALAPDDLDLDLIDPDTLLVAGLVLAFVLLVVVAVIAGVRRLREAVVPPLQRATGTVWRAISDPGRLALLVGGNVAAQCLYAASLLACLHAFGGSVDYFTLLALNIGVSTIASLVPVPGGGTAVSAVGLSGVLVSFGVPEATVVAAVLAHQLAVSYLPAIPGWFATRDLIRKGLL
jgi:uncharacterized membrane protein YbhN (UPF0104 family)